MAFSANRRSIWLAPLVLSAMLCGPSQTALAHVGSPDIYVEGYAGPYRLLVTVRPPQVIPGVAEIEVRAVGDANASISKIAIAPIPLTGEASLHPPVSDAMKQSASDKQFFTGALWIMASGSWQVRFTVDGSRGSGVFSVPVPATASSTQGMQTGLGILLSGLGLLLVAGVIGIVGAAARDAQLPLGETPTGAGRKRAWIAMSVALVVVTGIVIFGKLWWGNEADDYSQYVYKPLTMQATFRSYQVLRLDIQDPGWLKSRRVDDFVPDHDHLMHLYLIRQPGMDVVFHLHPEQVATGRFELTLPPLAGGEYKLYADVVHATGFPETMVSRITLPIIFGHALTGDDAEGIAPALSSPQEVNGCPVTPTAGAKFALPDGYTMVWNNPEKRPAKTPEVFEFSLLDAKGNPPSDMALYMGMQGHAAFVKDDGSVFAHVHPSGTASMAALMMAAAQNTPDVKKTDATAAMPGMNMSSEATTDNLPNSVGFPYGFPTAGAYRIFVQMKHGATIETAAFDACATAVGK